LTIWSNATAAKSENIIAATGRKPASAMPIEAPTKPVSEIGVSMTRSGPKKSSSPSVILNDPPAAPMSSPNRMTFSSARMASCSARLMASRYVTVSGVDMGRHLTRFRPGRCLCTFHRCCDRRLHVGIDRVDLLQVDVEGYDAEVVRMFDFDRWRPSIVNFEHTHLSPRDHESAMRHLVSHGYQIATTGVDTMGYASP